MLLALFSQTESHMVMPFSHGYVRKKFLGWLIVMKMVIMWWFSWDNTYSIQNVHLRIYMHLYTVDTHTHICYFYLTNKLSLGISSLESQLYPSQAQSLYFCLLMHFTWIILIFSHPQISCKIFKRENSLLYSICYQCCMLSLLDPNTKWIVSTEKSIA